MRRALAIAAILLAACTVERTAEPTAVASAKQTDMGAVVQTALAHPSVANFLHPEVPGRLPVTVAFVSPRGISSLDANLFGRPVRVVSPHQGFPAVILRVVVSGDQASVVLDYPPEGLTGEVVLHRQGAMWVVSSSQMRERRPNNSFKPKPLRGSA